MKAHKILINAGITPDFVDNFGEIARYVVEMQSQNINDVGTIIKAVQDEFGVFPSKPIQWRNTNGAPLTIFGKDLIDAQAIEQALNVSRSPVVEKVALMPDGHFGYAMPIGGVAALRNALSPSYIGYDIACRVTMTVFDFWSPYLDEKRQKIALAMQNVTHFGRGEAVFGDGHKRNHPVMADPLWDEIPVLRQYRDLAQSQLGSSGAGNHFLDFGTLEIKKQSQSLPHLHQGDRVLALMSHSGSRGVGHKLATYYMAKAVEYTQKIAVNVPKDHAWLSLDTAIGQEYWEVVKLMGRYAQANHHLIHAHFIHDMGLDYSTMQIRGGTTVSLGCTDADFDVIENHHNFAWETEPGLFVHRKGATPAAFGQLGLIPGSSGSDSFVVLGKGNLDSLKSSSHGAGRPFSRTEAKRRHDDKLMAKHYQDIDTFGLAQDETVAAYKDINAVMAAQTDLVEPIARFTPKIVLMGGSDGDDGD